MVERFVVGAFRSGTPIIGTAARASLVRPITGLDSDGAYVWLAKHSIAARTESEAAAQVGQFSGEPETDAEKEERDDGTNFMEEESDGEEQRKNAGNDGGSVGSKRKRSLRAA